MTNHHLIKNAERGGNCIYCSKELAKDRWESSFASRGHYKCVVCACGKSNCVKVDFIGTGHDAWSALEEKVEKSSSVKIVEKTMRII